VDFLRVGGEDPRHPAPALDGALRPIGVRLMPYILYGSRRSGSLAVELALAEIRADYEVRQVDLDANAQRKDAYAAVNPQRKIPALVTPAGETLTESVAILLTLDERQPEARLLPPAASAERASALAEVDPPVLTRGDPLSAQSFRAKELGNGGGGVGRDLRLRDAERL
jgi:glutathione S-transferase